MILKIYDADIFIYQNRVILGVVFILKIGKVPDI